MMALIPYDGDAGVRPTSLRVTEQPCRASRARGKQHGRQDDGTLGVVQPQRGRYTAPVGERFEDGVTLLVALGGVPHRRAQPDGVPMLPVRRMRDRGRFPTRKERSRRAAAMCRLASAPAKRTIQNPARVSRGRVSYQNDTTGWKGLKKCSKVGSPFWAGG